jgi:hypothetical protein
VSRDLLTETDLSRIAALIGSGNARRVYGLAGDWPARAA